MYYIINISYHVSMCIFAMFKKQTKNKKKSQTKIWMNFKAMDLLPNRLLGERHRALSTMHRLWRDFQRFDDTRVNRFTRRGRTWSRVAAAAVNAVGIVQGQWTKSIIPLRISVCDPLARPHFPVIMLIFHHSHPERITKFNLHFPLPTIYRCDQQWQANERESIGGFCSGDCSRQEEFRRWVSKWMNAIQK